MSSSKHTRPDLGLGDLLAELPVTTIAPATGRAGRRPIAERHPADCRSRG